MFLVVARGTVGGGGGVDEEAVGLRRPRHGGEPPVEHRELAGQGGVDRNLGREEALHDGGGSFLGEGESVLDEAGHCGGRGGVVAGEDLEADTLKGMVGVRIHVLGGEGDADGGRGGVGDVPVVALLAGEAVEGEAEVGLAASTPACGRRTCSPSPAPPRFLWDSALHEN